MSFEDCLRGQLKAGKIRGEKLDDALERYRGIRDRMVADGTPLAQAEVDAGAEALRQASVEKAAAAKVTLVHELRGTEIEAEMRRFKGDSAGAAKALIARDARAPYGNYAAARHTLRGQFQTALTSLIEEYKPRALGLVNRVTGLEDIVHELHGRDTGNALAKTIATAWRGTTDMGVDLWNTYGGALVKRGDWNLPQKPNPLKLMKAGRDTWVADHLQWLDWKKVFRPDGSYVPAAEREKFLRDVFTTIKTDGELKTGGPAGGPSTANRTPFHRVLVYKDGDAWMAAHKAYGDGSVYEVMTSHMERMAHELAMLKTFGPKPEEMRKQVKSTALRMAAEQDAATPGPQSSSARLKAESALDTFDQMWDHVTGRFGVGPEDKLAHFAASVRNVITSAYLGSAALAAVPGDFMTMAHANYFNKLPITQGMGRYFGLMIGDTAAREIAHTSGFALELATSSAYTLERFSGLSETGARWSKYTSEFVMRASGMAQHTEYSRLAWQIEWTGMWARDAGKSFDELAYKGVFERHGVTAADWDNLRTRASIYTPPERQAQMLRPQELFANGGRSAENVKLYDKFMMMLADEVRHAVPDTGIEATTMLKGGTKPGTLIGEVARSFAMFKNFPVGILLMNHRRMLMEAGSGRLAYAGALGVGLTAAGAMAVQLKEMTQGRNPIPMDSAAFWGKSFLTGGAAGIFGDFLFSGLNKFGHGATETAAGPVVTELKDWTDLTAGNLLKLIQGKDTTFAADAIRVASHSTPGTSLWYARLALQREVWNRLSIELDPKAHSKFRHQESKQLSDYGNTYWAPPGQSLFFR